MKNIDRLKHKICSLEQAIIKLDEWKSRSEKIVFTNGCFDLIHKGHIELLSNASDLGDRLIVALNSDRSIRKIKGNSRPIFDQSSRSMLLSALEFIDLVILFDDITPRQIISDLSPHILVKGGDYHPEDIVGYNIVKERGGDVVIIPLVEGFSTTKTIDRILKTQNG